MLLFEIPYWLIFLLLAFLLIIRYFTLLDPCYVQILDMMILVILVILIVELILFGITCFILWDKTRAR